MAGPIRISILANASQAQKEIRGFGSFLKGAVGFAAAGAGVALLTSKFKEAGSAVLEQRKLMAQTQAVLKSTGAAAGVSAKGVKSLADALEAKSTLDSEAIQSGENLLLTFTNIRNAAGKGNDVFTQTTQIMTDMSVALGQDTKSSAIQLGKALNDPIKGVSALSKVGVSFTEQQKKQIKTLQESGDTMGAQKVILAELNKEFGGSAAAAAAAAGPGRRLKIIMDDFFEAIVRKVLPALEKFAVWLETNLPIVIAAVRPHFEKLKAVAQELGEFLLNKVVPALVTLAQFVAKNKDFFKPFVAIILSVVAALKLWAIVQTALNIILSLNPLGLLVIAIAALIAGIIFAWKHSDRFRAVIMAVWNAVRGAASAIAGGLVAAVKAVGGFFSGMAGGISSAASAIAGFFTGLGSRIAKWVGNAARWLYNTGRSVVVGFIRGYNSFLNSAAGIIVRLASSVARWVGNTARTLYSKGRQILVGFAQGFTSYFGSLASAVGRVAGNVIRWIGSTARTLYSKGRQTLVGFAQGFASYLGSLAASVAGLGGKIVRWVGNLGSVLYGAGKAIIQGLIDGVSAKIGALKSKLSEITNLIPDIKGPLSKDKKLLQPAGKAIMDGLIRGIDSETARLTRQMQQITASIEGGISPSSSVSLAVAGTTLLGSRAASAPVIINVYSLTGGPETGRDVVKAIQAYERDNGARWRA